MHKKWEFLSEESTDKQEDCDGLRWNENKRARSNYWWNSSKLDSEWTLFNALLPAVAQDVRRSQWQ